MLDIIPAIEKMLRDAVAACFGNAFSDVDPLVQPANNPKFGDYQANLAMPLSKRLGKDAGNPREVAQQIMDALELDERFDVPTIAGPGFVNFTLKPAALADIANALAGDDRLGVCKAEPPQTVVIDYSSPNVAKEMHVGHLRSTVIGDALARVLAFQGHTVKRQNHLGDWGTQFGRIMLSVWYEAAAGHNDELSMLERWLDLTGDSETDWNLLTLDVHEWNNQRYEQDNDGKTFFESFLDNEPSFPDLARLDRLYTFVSKVFSSDVADELVVKVRDGKELRFSQLPSYVATMVQDFRNPANSQEERTWNRSRQISLDACQDVYERMGITLKRSDVRGESFYSQGEPDEHDRNRLVEVIDKLENAGQLTDSSGAKVVQTPGFTDRDGNPLPFMVQKSDGGYLYGTTDLAAARYRIGELGGERLIYVVGSPQRLHFEMLFATLRHLDWDQGVGLEFVGFGSVLGRDGKKLSSRSGGAVRLVELLDEADERAATVVRDKTAERGGDFSEEEIAAMGRTIGMAAIKYADLSSDRIKDYVFD